MSYPLLACFPTFKVTGTLSISLFNCSTSVMSCGFIESVLWNLQSSRIPGAAHMAIPPVKKKVQVRIDCGFTVQYIFFSWENAKGHFRKFQLTFSGRNKISFRVRRNETWHL